MASIKLPFEGDSMPYFKATACDGCITIGLMDDERDLAQLDATPDAVQGIINLLQTELDKFNKEIT